MFSFRNIIGWPIASGLVSVISMFFSFLLGNGIQPWYAWIIVFVLSFATTLIFVSVVRFIILSIPRGGMMVVDISDFKPHNAGHTICVKCGNRCMTVWPAVTPMEKLECDECNEVGFIVLTNDPLYRLPYNGED